MIMQVSVMQRIQFNKILHLRTLSKWKQGKCPFLCCGQKLQEEYDCRAEEYDYRSERKVGCGHTGTGRI